MSNRSSRTISTSRFGFFQEISLRVRLILRLMGDRRVNPFLKLIPIASLVYLINPIDLPGPIDDALVVYLGSYFFVEMCPPGIVQEHMQALRLNIAGSSPDAPAPKEEVIDAEFHDVTGEDTSDPGDRPA
jgi:hypothetical protein